MKLKSVVMRGFLLCCGLVAMAGVTHLRAEETPQNWNMGFALTFPQGSGPAENALRDGFGLNLNAGYQKPTQMVGFRVDMIYANFHLTDAVISRLDNATEGSFDVFGGGASLVFNPRIGKRVQPSVYAGPGIYHEHAEATWDDSCDPVFGCPAGGSDYTTTRLNTTRLGWQGGAGLDFFFDDGGVALSVNVQYIRINNTQVDMEIMPINVGYKVMF
jgi:opacity protein-like surface antigen